MFLTQSDHPWTQVPMPDGEMLRSFGAGPHNYDDSGARCIGPLFYADVEADADATVLGVLDPLDQPGLVVRHMDGWQNVYCSATYVHNALLRQIGKDAGAHLYVDTDDLVHAAAELLLLHARRAGTKRIRWPVMAETVFDLVTECELANACTQWSLEMKEHETRFLFAGSRRAAQEVRDAMRGGLTCLGARED